MRIAVDARLNAYRQGGISQYTRQLVGALAELAPEETFVTLQHREHQRPLYDAPNVERAAMLTPPHHRLERWTLPIELLRLRPSVLHCPDFVAPALRPCPAVVTIHDLAFLYEPAILDDNARAYYGQVRASATRADAIIAVSEATRADIVEQLQIDPGCIDVVYEAAAPCLGPLELEPGAVRQVAGQALTAGSFALFVSTIEPRKNLATLFEALRLCRERAPGVPYRLVVVGARGWHDEPILARLRELRLGQAVLLAGKADDETLRWLYSACRMYINPSLYEGFGLPLLEAMQCGAACLASDTSSLPEIGGEAAQYVPARDVDAWAQAIAALWHDDELRAELGRRGQARARTFSWARAARETLAIYRRIAR
jgi:glycosyltransferase involved in cell wall biosynthesis